MKLLPIVSVIVPLYNQAKYLEDAIKSILKQTYENIEIIVVNDGSSDDYKRILNQYKTIRLIEQKNQGLAIARNNGISIAHGEYILPLDADDMIRDTMIEECIKKILAERSDIVYTDAYYFGEYEAYIKAKDKIVLENLKYENCLSYCSLYKKEVWEVNSGYSNGMDGGYEDWEFWINAKKKNYKFSYIPKDLFLYRVKSNSMYKEAVENDIFLKAKIVLNNQDIYSKNEINKSIVIYNNKTNKKELYFYSNKDIIFSKNVVLLYGGYSGYDNFGDILQAKWAIDYHKKNTKLIPILICDIHSIRNIDDINNLKKNLDIQYIIFYSNIPYNLDKYELFEIDFSNIMNFHNYGGGVINRYWIDWYIFLIENIFKKFNVKRYILTGQQVDPAVKNKLKIFFDKYKVDFLGVRDTISFDGLQDIENKKLYNTFDDALDTIKEISRIFKYKKISKQQIFLHLNITSYTHNEDIDIIEYFKNIINILKNKFTELEINIIVAFDDLRVADVVDTLSVVKELEDFFSFFDFKVINLARLALMKRLNEVYYEVDPDAVFISSSYHVAMLGKVLCLKTYLFHLNDYYQQKREGLDIKEESFLEFINNKYIDYNFYQRKKRIRNSLNIRKLFIQKKSNNINLKINSYGFRFVTKRRRENIHSILYNKDIYINRLENLK